MSTGHAWVRGISADVENAERDHFYPTPERATHALLDVEQFDGLVWEPACGDGAISRVFEERGHEVLSTDLIDRGYGTPNRDFLLEFQTTAPNIVTNAPFKFSEEFAWHALARSSRKVALLCRLAWLEGKARRVLFTTTPLIRVWVFSSRLTMARGGTDLGGGSGGMVAFAWFVWQHGYVGPPTLGWLP